MENRRDFFKALGLFAAGVVGAKIASYTPSKEDKETMLVSNNITITGADGKEYHPVVVKRAKIDETPIEERVDDYGGIKFHRSAPKSQVRKLKV